MGPGIVLASDLPNLQALLLTTRVNGQIVQHVSTATKLFSVAMIVSFLSSLMTLEPGDIIATGIPAGVGFKRTPARRDITAVRSTGLDGFAIPS